MDDDSQQPRDPAAGPRPLGDDMLVTRSLSELVAAARERSAMSAGAAAPPATGAPTSPPDDTVAGAAPADVAAPPTDIAPPTGMAPPAGVRAADAHATDVSPPTDIAPPTGVRAAVAPTADAWPTAPADEPGPSPTRRRSRTRTAVEWGVLLVLALLAAVLIKTFLVQAFYIPSGSMHPTLVEGDRVLVNKLAYRWGDPQRGDIVVFERPPGEPDTAVKDLIKRVIAVPGDTITTDEIGRILVNGRRIEEAGYIEGGGSGISTTRIPEQRIPEDHYWVMGDNRDHSKDSRVFGPIPRSLLVGKAFLRVWPLSNLGTL